MSKFSQLLTAIVIVIFSLTSSASSQFIVFYQKDGAAVSDWLGISVAGTGDVDGDGKTDFIVGALYADPGGLAEAGSAFVYSGATGALIFQKNGAAIGDALGHTVAGTGDVNGDRRADFIISAPGADPGGLSHAGSAFVYSGADGSLLYQKDGVAVGDELGLSVAGAGDVSGDGKADFIIGAPYADPDGLPLSGTAFVYSGGDGSLLFQKKGAASFDVLGIRVAGVGDINKDKRSDFIIGAPGADPNGLNAAGSVFVYSGLDGSLLFQKNGAAVGDQLGYAVAGSGDVNRDAKADFIVGAPTASPNGFAQAGSVFVYSGADGSLLFQKNGAAGEGMGTSIALVEDISNDGKSEFIIGAARASPSGLDAAGSVFVYSGANGSLLFRMNGTTAGDNLGVSVAGLGDVNGDKKGDFIAGAHGADPRGFDQAGSCFVYSGTSSSSPFPRKRRPR